MEKSRNYFEINLADFKDDGKFRAAWLASVIKYPWYNFPSILPWNYDAAQNLILKVPASLAPSSRGFTQYKIDKIVAGLYKAQRIKMINSALDDLMRLLSIAKDFDKTVPGYCPHGDNKRIRNLSPAINEIINKYEALQAVKK